MVCHNPSSFLPPDRGVRHEIDLVPDTKSTLHNSGLYQRNNLTSLTSFSVLSTRRGNLRESKSPHSTPTFCVKKPNGIVHAYNKTNAATILAQTPIPEKDILQTT